MKTYQDPQTDPLKTLKNQIKGWGVKAKEREVFEFKNVSVGEILSVVNKLGVSSAFSHDSIDAITLKNASDILAALIMHLTNISIQNSNFSSKLEKS